MFKFFLVTSLLGAIANLVQAPWNFFFLIFLIFPILHIILDKIIRNQKYRKRLISIFILLGGFLYFYFLFGFSWIIYAFEYKPELSSFKYITLDIKIAVFPIIDLPGSKISFELFFLINFSIADLYFV